MIILCLHVYVGLKIINLVCCLNYKSKEYTIVFEWYYDNNPNDFIICNASWIICDNLNRLNQRKRL